MISLIITINFVKISNFCNAYSQYKIYKFLFNFQILKTVESVVKYLFLIFPPFSYASAVKDLAFGYTKVI